MPLMFPRWGLALACLTLAACVQGPDYLRPSQDPPAQYKEAGGRAWRVATPADLGERGAWWELFGDPVLNELQTELAAGNLDLQAAQARWREAEAQSRQARAGLFPSLSGELSQDRSGGSADSRRASVAVTARWEADLWGGQRRLWEAAEASADAQAAEWGATRLAAQSGLALDYVALRVAETQAALLESQAAQYEKAVQLTRNRHRAGVVAGNEVAEAETQWRSTQARAIDRRALRARLEHAIAVRLGQAPAALNLAPGALPPQPPALPLEVPSQLLERRPDIAAAERRMMAANARIGAAQAAGFPALTLSGGLSRQAGDLAGLLAAPTRIWTLGATLGQILFDAGKTAAQVDEARAAFDAALAEYRAEVLAGFQEVEDQLSDLRLLADQAQVQRLALEAARRSARLTSNQYQAGTLSYLDVVTVQARALAAELDAINLEGQRLSAAVGLIKALGGGWTATQRPAP